MVKILQVLFTVAGISAVFANCPDIVPREGWAPREARFIPALAIRPAPFVIVHPTGTDTCETQAECSAIIRDIQAFQLDSNGWPDISYHFLIGGDNRIYQGRGWSRMGQNVGGFTNQAINIGYIGRFVNDRPSEEAAQHLESLLECGISLQDLSTDAHVIAQCQATPMVGCSATAIFEWISEHLRFNEDPRRV